MEVGLRTYQHLLLQLNNRRVTLIHAVTNLVTVMFLQW